MPQGRDPRARDSSPNDSLRTLRLDEGAALRDQLTQALRDERRPVLVVMSGDEIGARKRLDGSTVIGRAPDADLRLSDAGVSWLHARIEDRGGAWAVVDLGSTNGLSVNGRKVTDAVLTTNDRIALGRTVLRFEEQDELAQAYDEQMERLLSLDDLSGLLLRRRFDREFSLLLDGIKRGRSALSLLVMDLDGIKKINDTHGHAFGAFVIGQAGRRIGAVVGDRGIASRFGGDEFCAALPDMDGEGAFALATEVLDAIGEAPFVREGIELRPGISIGVATFPADADNASGLFQRADEAMYRAKSSGKHRVSR